MKRREILNIMEHMKEKINELSKDFDALVALGADRDSDIEAYYAIIYGSFVKLGVNLHGATTMLQIRKPQLEPRKKETATSAPMPGKKLLTVKEASKYISKSPGTVRAYIRTGKIRGFKPNGRDIYLKPADLDDFMDKGATVTTADIEAEADRIKYRFLEKTGV